LKGRKSGVSTIASRLYNQISIEAHQSTGGTLTIKGCKYV